MNYMVYLSTRFNPKKDSSGIVVIEPDDYKDSEIKAIKKKGYKVLAYLSVGTIEKERKWYTKYKKYRLQRLDDWPNEWYVDITKDAWQDFLKKRATELCARGFDGLWCDNLDVYEYNKSPAMYVACMTILRWFKKHCGYVMVNGGSELFDTMMDDKSNLSITVNGVTQEEVFTLIKSYSGKGKFGTQEKDQHKWYKSYMKRLKKHGVQTFLLEYSRSDAMKKKIKTWCKDNDMTGYYISGNVDL